jgi:hypothetical protein
MPSTVNPFGVNVLILVRRVGVVLAAGGKDHLLVENTDIGWASVEASSSLLKILAKV